MPKLIYKTPGGISVTRQTSSIPFRRGLGPLMHKLDRYRGIYLSSGYEYPERYSRWDVASVCPPIEIVSSGRDVEFNPLNARGEVLSKMLFRLLEQHPHWEQFGFEGAALRGRLKPLPALFPEEERSKQPSAFSILRALIGEFHSDLDSRLALVGAFGYDLLFQFDPIQLKLPRHGVKDLQLFLCDDIYYMDRKKEQIERFRYDFELGDLSTAGLGRTGTPARRSPKRPVNEIESDHQPAEYMAKVEAVREGMRQGEYYEVVLRQTFQANYSESPSALFQRIQKGSPSPYEFFLQLGDEQLIGASPEMFVRVEGRRVETCPISGTARRTGDPLRDADNIRELLNSTKEESELTMCTDVDRNDKSRVSIPGSVKVIGRRLIESYAGVFHTVDHVEGFLQPGFDSLDAFLTHMWAVTIMGAPKKAAAQAIEDLEKDARAWYGGAVGMLSLNGDINTGILIRTVHLRDGVARYSAGATLLYDSVPELEEQETRLKATGFFRALRGLANAGAGQAEAPACRRGTQAAAGGQRRLFYTHAIQLRAPDWRGGSDVPRGSSTATDSGFFAAPDSDLAGSGPALRFRRSRSGEVRGASRHSSVRRVSGAARDCGGVRRRAGRAGLPHARQTLHRGSSQPGSFRGAAGAFQSRPVSFAVRATGNLAGLPGGDG